MPRAWEIGYMQPCINCQGKAATHFVYRYFWSCKTLPYTQLEATSYISQQGQSLHIWTTSLSTTGCYKNKYTIQFLWMACISRFDMAILIGETELALGTIRIKWYNLYKINMDTEKNKIILNTLWKFMVCSPSKCYRFKMHIVSRSAFRLL